MGDYSDGLPSSKSAYFRGDTQALFREAYRYLGVPYHWGWRGLTKGDVPNDLFAPGLPLYENTPDRTAIKTAAPIASSAPTTAAATSGALLRSGGGGFRRTRRTGSAGGTSNFVGSSGTSGGARSNVDGSRPDGRGVLSVALTTGSSGTGDGVAGVSRSPDRSVAARIGTPDCTDEPGPKNDGGIVLGVDAGAISPAGRGAGVCTDTAPAG